VDAPVSTRHLPVIRMLLQLRIDRKPWCEIEGSRQVRVVGFGRVGELAAPGLGASIAEGPPPGWFMWQLVVSILSGISPARGREPDLGASVVKLHQTVSDSTGLCAGRRPPLGF
jgi:hypothetical protein